MALPGEPGHRPLDELIPPDDPASSSTDDQRNRPRTGPIEQIADVAYDTLRKYEVEPPNGKTPEDPL
jgi:hypothetical protein